MYTYWTNNIYSPHIYNIYIFDTIWTGIFSIIAPLQNHIDILYKYNIACHFSERSNHSDASYIINNIAEELNLPHISLLIMDILLLDFLAFASLFLENHEVFLL